MAKHQTKGMATRQGVDYIRGAKMRFWAWMFLEENEIYLEKSASRKLETKKRKFLTSQKMKLTKGKRILKVQTKLDKSRKSQKVKQKTWLPNGSLQIRDSPQRPR